MILSAQTYPITIVVNLAANVAAAFSALLICVRLLSWDRRDGTHRSRYLITFVGGSGIAHLCLAATQATISALDLNGSYLIVQIGLLAGYLIMTVAMTVFVLYLYGILNGVQPPPGKVLPTVEKSIQLIAGIEALTKQLNQVGIEPNFEINDVAGPELRATWKRRRTDPRVSFEENGRTGYDTQSIKRR